jgi:hypothetical protein
LLVLSLPDVLFPKQFLSCRENSVPVPATSRLSGTLAEIQNKKIVKMSFFKNLFGKNDYQKTFDINHLLQSEDINKSIIEIDNYVCELCNWGENLEKLSEPQKIFYFNQMLEREVNNGGFDLYFTNSSGQYSQETVESLKSIGAKKTADILLRAIDDNSEETLQQLDNDFFQYQDDLNTLNIEYIRKNKSEF